MSHRRLVCSAAVAFAAVAVAGCNSYAFRRRGSSIQQATATVASGAANSHVAALPSASVRRHFRSVFDTRAVVAAAPVANPDVAKSNDGVRLLRRRLRPLLAEARQRLLLVEATAADVVAALAPVRAALAEAHSAGYVTDAELHRLSAAIHSRLAADCLAAADGDSSRRDAAEWLLRAELQDLLLAGWAATDPPVVETSVRLSNLLLNNGRTEAGLTGLEFAVDGASAGLAEFEAREAHSLRLAGLVAEMGPGVLGDVTEAGRLSGLLEELNDRRALKGLAQSNLAKALLHYRHSKVTETRALDLLRSALDAARQTYPAGRHANVACLLNDIGALLCQMNRHAEAVASLSAALDTADQLLRTAANDLDAAALTGAILCNLGEALTLGASATTAATATTAASAACQRAMLLSSSLRDDALSHRAHYCMALVERRLAELAAAAEDTLKNSGGSLTDSKT